MANTYTQLYVQLIFAVQGRQNIISKIHREEIHKYLTGITTKRKHKLLSVFCMPDHTHLLVGLQPLQSISDLARDLKTGSSHFINQKRWIRGHFNWQVGFGAFSYSKREISSVISYINNQEEHHQKKTFKEEYFDFLNTFAIEYKEEYLFDWIQ